MIFPELLRHIDGHLYALRGLNRIAWWFGRQIKVCRVKHVIGPIYRRTSHDFFEGVNYFRTLSQAEEQIR